jgi:hypothetical protein
MKTPSLVLAATLTLGLSAAVTAAPLSVGASDTIASVMSAQKGARVTLRLKSGQELTGVVRSVGSSVVHLGELTGKEYFDAAVGISDIEAVVVRVRDR